jgi:hypothetical protein
VRAIIDGLININIAISDFQIESTFRVGAHPGFILNRGSLAAKIRKRHQVTGLAFLTLGEIVVRFQKSHLPTSK